MPTTRRRSTNSHLARTRRARKFNRILAQAYPDAQCELNFSNPLELTVATILSAQCTDARVNTVTPALFARYPEAHDYASANEAELQHLIHSTGFYKAKARNIIAMAQQLVSEHHGEVPEDFDALIALPGVGRKTAHCVRGNAFGYPGLTVDTHFGRLVRRWELTNEEDPVKVEHEIAALLPKEEWTMFSHRLVFHGRRVCHSRKPACGACLLKDHCPSFGLGPRDALAADLLKGPNTAHLLELAGLLQTEERQAQ